MFIKYFNESTLSKATKIIKKNGHVVLIDNVGIEIFVDEISGGWAYGVDQFDKDIEIDLSKVGKEYKIQESKESIDDIPPGGMSYREIAERLGLTEKQVKQLEKTGLRKLSAPTAKNKAFRKTMKEGTGTGDIAQATGKFSKLHKKKLEQEDLDESPVGQRGRTDAKSALAHVTPALKKQFRKLLKDVGGKTVMRYLLADAPLQEGMKGALKGDLESSLYTIQQNCKSKKIQDAVDEVLDLMDTDC